MLPVYYTTTNTRKRKRARNQSQIAAEKEHEKFLKKWAGYRALVAQLDQSNGLLNRGSQVRVLSRAPKVMYDSSMAKKEEKVLGTEIIGIAQMHKSNAVPVRGKKQATEVATMRRN